ncbi:acyl-CoA dehydrogenase family protein [Aquisalinus flavus]|uniref:Acyl-CoA dehydrogenase n=1 Tax=Aquisalinus flavus TaxID=1526572 RepID=A0A8J2Y5H4_9PROT|nr:acyl-CoA dehydrogenase family protein [Aquisalinus flavus]MBD0427049.1 acyl-CoA dehydrogenase family protein [Aquisalinus flavus]UNE46875.1 pimeloyl-CoA dehydrogenase small subunit [Aquisalinus flavus]GGC97983.1 acyl-CoA dehydrogenase [Aquisalinus flavus]
MNFDLTDEQEMIRESLSRFLRDRYDFEARGKIIRSEAGWNPEVWGQLAELGLMAVPFAEAHGGLDGGPTDIMVVMEELGRALVVEPYLPTVVLAGSILQAVGGTVAEELIPQIAGGELVMGLAYAEPRSRYDLFHVETTAEKTGDAYALAGHKSVVLAAPLAGRLIVSARTDGGTRDRDGIGLFLVDPQADGVTVKDYRTIDGFAAGDVILDKAPATLIGTQGEGLALLEMAVDRGIIACAAEMTGLAKRMTELTVDYTRQREQFGVPLSKQQVLQHTMADMFMAGEEMKSMAVRATALADADPEERAKAAAMAKVFIGKTGKFVGEAAVQLHGGMGITEEMAIGHYFMHATMLDTLFGNRDYHQRRYEMLTGLRKDAA